MADDQTGQVLTSSDRLDPSHSDSSPQPRTHTNGGAVTETVKRAGHPVAGNPLPASAALTYVTVYQKMTRNCPVFHRSRNVAVEVAQKLKRSHVRLPKEEGRGTG